MQIDLSSLNSNIAESITLECSVEFDQGYLERGDLLGLHDVHVVGAITKDSEENYILNCKVAGVMELEDSISLDPIDQPFSLEIQDEIVKTYEKDENSLDLLEVLWQNIILEIPLKVTKVENFENFQGDGWKLISEEDLKGVIHPFDDLKSMMGEE